MIIRNDLSQWIYYIFIDEKERGKYFSLQPLIHVRAEARTLDYDVNNFLEEYYNI